MAKTKKELLAEAKKLGLDLDKKLTNKDIQAAIDAALTPTEPDPSEATKVIEKSELAVEAAAEEAGELTGAKLLPLVEGFESEVAQLKHLEIKVANPGKNGPVLLRQLEAQKRVVNGFLKKVKNVTV